MTTKISTPLAAALVVGLLGASSLGASAKTVECIGTEPFETPDGSLTPGFTGLGFGTVYCGNDPFDGQGGYINGTPSLAKIDIPDGWEEGDPFDYEDGIGPGDQSDAFALSLLDIDDDEIKGGTWTFTPQVGELSPSIAVIKAGPGFFLLNVAGLLSGIFDTVLLGSKGLSHISFYDTGRVDVPGEVPLPAALPLLLGALGGMGWLAQRRNRKIKT